MKKSVRIVIFIVVVVLLLGTSVFIFRERQLVPEGYSIERTGGSVNNLTSSKEVVSWEEGYTIVERNSRYPDQAAFEFLIINTDELETILKTAKCRVTLSNYSYYASSKVKYRFHVVLINGDKVRHVMLCLGTDSWDDRGRVNNKIQNGDSLIAALDVVTNTRRVE